MKNRQFSPYDNMKPSASGSAGTPVSQPRPAPVTYSAPAAQPRPASAAKEIPADYADAAEKVIKAMSDATKVDRYAPVITTTKLRNLFSLFIDVYGEAKVSGAAELTAEQETALTGARVRIVYECGRENNVKDFVNRANLMTYLASVGKDREKLIRFYHYMEALVAYHRFYFGDKK